MSATPEDCAGLSWFGRSWGAEVNQVFEQVPVPVGKRCRNCAMLLRDRDSGVRIPLPRGGFLYYHLMCWAAGPD